MKKLLLILVVPLFITGCFWQKSSNYEKETTFYLSQSRSFVGNEDYDFFYLEAEYMHRPIPGSLATVPDGGAPVMVRQERHLYYLDKITGKISLRDDLAHLINKKSIGYFGVFPKGISLQNQVQFDMHQISKNYYVITYRIPEYISNFPADQEIGKPTFDFYLYDIDKDKILPLMTGMNLNNQPYTWSLLSIGSSPIKSADNVGSANFIVLSYKSNPYKNDQEQLLGIYQKYGLDKNADYIAFPVPAGTGASFWFMNLSTGSKIELPYSTDSDSNIISFAGLAIDLNYFSGHPNWMEKGRGYRVVETYIYKSPEPVFTKVNGKTINNPDYDKVKRIVVNENIIDKDTIALKYNTGEKIYEFTLGDLGFPLPQKYFGFYKYDSSPAY